MRTPARHPRQSGFSLVQIALVMVVVGLLVGGFLKGQELMTGSRVRGIIENAANAEVAFLGFMDRYHRIAGDWNAADASNALGVPINGGGNDNYQLDNPPGGPDVYTETNAMWEQLSKAGLIGGEYAGTPATEPTLVNNLAPLNPYGQVVVMGRTSDFLGSGGRPRLNLAFGRGLTGSVVREIDLKLDDGLPASGLVRATDADADVDYFTASSGRHWGGREPGCLDTGAGDPRWAVGAAVDDCNAVILMKRR